MTALKNFITGFWKSKCPKLIMIALKNFIAGFWKSKCPKANKLPEPVYDSLELPPELQAALLTLLSKKNDSAMVVLHSLKKDHVVRKLNLPETKGKVCFSSLGWLVTVSEDEEVLTFNMLHPSNYTKIELPGGGDRTTFLGFPLDNILKFVVSSSTSDYNYIVMFHSYSTLGFCRPGIGQSWKRLTFDDHNYFIDLTYYLGDFYVVNRSGRVSAVCDIEDPERVHLRIVAPDIPDVKELLGPQKGIKHLYLVESAGSLLVVVCTFNHSHYETTTGCRVFKVPFKNGNSWSDSEVKNLGNRALFLSKNSSSYSVEVSGNSGCKANCIYFMNNKVASSSVYLDNGIFHMEDGTIEGDFSNSFNTGLEETRESHLWNQPCPEVMCT